MFHIAPALPPMALPFFAHRDVWGPLLICLAAGVTILGLTLAATLRRYLKRPGESNWAYAVLGYMMPVVAALLLFPGRAELGLMTLQIVALGDGSATFAGLLIGGPKLPWNRAKTYSGFITFIVVGTIASTYSYWGEADPSVSVGLAAIICGASTAFAGIAESLPIPSNDNFRVGITACLTGVVISEFLVY